MVVADNAHGESCTRRRVEISSEANEATTYSPKPDFDAGAEFTGGEDLYAVELFCGTAGLTAVMRTVVPSSFGVDHQVTKPRSKVIKLDLSDANAQKLVLQWVCDPRCIWVHVGVPCGTSSRAREVRMSKMHNFHQRIWQDCGRRTDFTDL